MPHSSLMEQVLDIARSAGHDIMRYYAGKASVSFKEDSSPVTEADIAAHHIIVDGLRLLDPSIAIVSEEANEEDNVTAAQQSRFWLIDPLDGTKSFIKKTDEFTVNIALIEAGKPIAGVVYVPAQDVMYYTLNGKEAFKQVRGVEPVRIVARQAPEDGVVVVASKSHRTPETDAFIATLKVASILSASSSVKLCLVAEGEADVYPRFGRTMEWDIAAGHAVLEASGGAVRTEDGQPLLYGKRGLDNPYFIASGLVV